MTSKYKNLKRRILPPYEESDMMFFFAVFLVAVMVIVAWFTVLLVVKQRSQAGAANLGVLTVSWSQPTGYASFVDNGGVKDYCSGATSCTTPKNSETNLGKFWPGSDLIYSVKVSNSSGAVIKSGGVKASTSGRGSANWSWKYAAVVYPDYPGATCQNTGTACKQQTNLTTTTATFVDLPAGVQYKKIVCTPDCGTGTKIHESSSLVTLPQKAVLSGVITNCSKVTDIRSENVVNVAFGWTKASGATFDQQFLDYSVYDNGFSQSFVGVDVGTNASTLPRTGFAQGTKYYWRIHSHIANGSWVASDTGTFSTPVCGPPSAVGEQRTAVIMFNFRNDTATPVTKDEARARIFTNGDSANGWLKEISYGRSWLSGDIYGYYTLPIDKTSTTCANMKPYVIAAADKDVNFLNYTRIIFIMRENAVACNWTGQSGWVEEITTADGKVQVSHLFIMDSMISSTQLLQHELTHTIFQVGHSGGWECGTVTVGGSCRAIEYYDPFDPLGYYSLSGSKPFPNAATMDKGKWLDQNITTVSATGSFVLENLETPSSKLKVLKVPTILPNIYYYVEYRQPIGLDQRLGGNVFNGVLLHMNVEQHPDGPTIFPQLLDTTPGSADSIYDFDDAALTVGKTFTDPATGTKIKVNSKDGSTINVSVTFAGDINRNDVNGDGLVDCTDFSLVKGALGTTQGKPGFNSSNDVNGNGAVSLQDVAIILSAIGHECP